MRFFFVYILLLAFASAVFGQAETGSLHPELTVLSQPSAFAELAADEIELTRFKKQPLQSIAVAAGWLGDVSGEGLNIAHLDTSLGTGIPLGSFDNILAVTPRVRIDWTEAASSIDIPDTLYLFETQFFYRRPINERLSVMGIFSPSIRSDLTTSDNAFRVFALGLLNWDYIPDKLTLSGGVVSLGRADLPVLPALGLVWKPGPRSKLDLRFPSSQFSFRLAKNGGFSEHWAYLSAGIGGDTWAVTRRSSLSDELSLRDLRFTLGLEKLLDGGGGWFAEGVFALNRRLEYENDGSELRLGNGISFSAGWRY